MKTLDEYEVEKRQQREKTGTGIQCPVCGDELVLSNPYFVLTSYPPQKAVHCQTCKYKNTITA